LIVFDQKYVLMMLLGLDALASRTQSKLEPPSFKAQASAPRVADVTVKDTVIGRRAMTNVVLTSTPL
jgi:hypothetical protein